MTDKTPTARLLNGFTNEPFLKFIDVKILKIDLKIQQEIFRKRQACLHHI